MRAVSALSTLLAGVLLAGCSPKASGSSAAAPAGAAPRNVPAARPLTAAERLERGQRALRQSDYERAEADLRATAVGAERAQALLSLAELYLTTGRYDEAAKGAERARAAGAAAHEAAWIEGEALRRQGKLAEARASLEAVRADPAARRARLLLGEILLELGKRAEAEPVLMTLIEDYNEDRIDPSDGRGLAMVGRAAHLLRSPHDANDAFNQAEQAARGDIQTLLWRAELFLEKYDPGHAEEVIREVLRQAPRHPEALVWLAHVKLAQAFDFDAAERLARRALAVNPKLAEAYFVLGGIALRDMELEVSHERIDKGLGHNPGDLSLLSLKATAYFLGDEQQSFERAKRVVLEKNPEYSRLYQIIGEYADWEHRYLEIVEMMREAVRIDPEDAKALAQLGLNLIRSGDDDAGVAALQQAFDMDPFNVRVFNTLNLYEKEIPKNYVTVDHGKFRVRYHKDEKAVLERYVPALLEQAWAKMVEAYGFEPKTPIGVELYAERQNFAVRTSGLPQTAIQGVCFGNTLALMSPMKESFNVGMTLWHELAHVFHIQLSRSRVPRWFTEGLAEYETIVQRSEWAREQDPDFYEALRSQRLPELGAMSRAFTRAEEMQDVATAYYASSQIVAMLAEQYGRPKLAKMLALWGAGKETSEVLAEALGATTEELNRRFRDYAAQKLSRYKQQFVPMSRTRPLEVMAKQARQAPNDAEAQAGYALALIRAGRRQQGEKTLEAALKLDPKQPDARFLKARLLVAKKQLGEAEKTIQALRADGHDGYAVQMMLATFAEARKDKPAELAALRAAHGFDPTQAEPLQALADAALRAGDTKLELEYLRKLALLEQHDPRVYRRLLRRLIDAKRFAEARTFGEMALFADLEGLATHALYAEALVGDNQPERALFELESALLCPGDDRQRADVHAQLAGVFRGLRRTGPAKDHAARAKQLDADNPRLKQFGF